MDFKHIHNDTTDMKLYTPIFQIHNNSENISNIIVNSNWIVKYPNIATTLVYTHIKYWRYDIKSYPGLPATYMCAINMFTNRKHVNMLWANK